MMHVSDKTKQPIKDTTFKVSRSLHRSLSLQATSGTFDMIPENRSLYLVVATSS